ncbi:hypothetical protein ACRE_036380 [Hapsidospora chrysogenum ATCC 11550]|uniref:Uncharacterized protein n=1 Tax=Hapsidospora chrysogenum (strain ATCC 11550 / CBS 779.69 / DSM 880 / IAM 14645 / JCM 23072 / IMI 49137) TaxID=857340 RepID=A0A086T870_HAPC1|nr:hypothetical protein ACRE_036380 [Hapsidospora chrysogenum ATCC 11550]
MAMPPIRTAKNHTSSGAQAPAGDPPKRLLLLKSIPKGVVDAHFTSSERARLGQQHINDHGLLGLFQDCPNLNSVEVTGHSRGIQDAVAGRALDELREHPERAPKLRKLILGEGESNKVFMKAMHALTKERENRAHCHFVLTV